MTTYDLLFDGTHPERPTRFSLLAHIRRMWEAVRPVRRRRDQILSMADMDERLLRDIGIDPRDVHDALNDHLAASVLFYPVRRDL